MTAPIQHQTHRSDPGTEARPALAYLRLVGLSEDGTQLVLVDEEGAEHVVAVDDRLRAAVHPRSTPAPAADRGMEKTMESTLRPRDIQARIRSGESPETVAQAAQTSVEKIMVFAAPVLAEREHVASRAQRSSVRRSDASPAGGARTLGDAVAAHLRSHNVDPESVEWDAWRREDGRWALVADYRHGERSKHAEFVFDAPGRFVVAENDEARLLLGEQPVKKPAAPRPAEPAARRLSPVGSEDELPLGEDVIGMVSPQEHRPVSADEVTVDLSQTAQQVRRRSVPEVGEPAAATGDADWMATQATERPAGRRDPEPRTAEPAATSPVETPVEQADEPAARDAEQPAEGDEATKPEAPAKKGRRNRRASVPSWDEIMFGGGRSE